MMRAFECGLDALRTEHGRNPNGYALYKMRGKVYCVYFKRMLPAMEQFVRRALKMAHNFLSHPVGLGLMALPIAGSAAVAIPRGTFLGVVSGKKYSVIRWMERAFCAQKMEEKLRSGTPLRARQPFWIEAVDEEKGYRVCGVVDADRLKLNASCSPNVELRPFEDGQRGMTLALWTTADIATGCELTVDYRWSSSDGDGCCRESICLCGSRQCRGTFVRFKRSEIEDDQYLMARHQLVRHRMVHLLMATLSPLTEHETAALDRLHFEFPSRHRFGQWMPKYFAFLALFIESEHRALASLLFDTVNRRNQYTLIDAQRDADEVMLRRMRSLSVTAQRITYFLEKQLVLNRQIPSHHDVDIEGDSGHRSRVDGHELAAMDEESVFLLPPLRFAEMDEVIGRLWNDSDSLIQRVLASISGAVSPALFQLIGGVVAKQGLIEESQSGLHLVRCKLVEIAKMLRFVKIRSKMHRAAAAADILFLYALTLRFMVHRPFLSFAAEHSDHAVSSSFRAVKRADNRYLTRSVRKETVRNDTIRRHEAPSNEGPSAPTPPRPPRTASTAGTPPPPSPRPSSSERTKGGARSHSDSVRFIYSSHFAVLALLGWHHHCGPDGDHAVHGNVQREYESVYGVALLPDIESCFDAECKGLYIESHRNYIAKCMLRRTKWMKPALTEQYELRDCQQINSCPVPQFTFTNSLGLWGSPVFDSFLSEHSAANQQEKEYGMTRLTQIVRAMQQDFHFEM